MTPISLEGKNKSTIDKIITLANDPAHCPGGFLSRALTRILIERAGSVDNKQHLQEVISDMVDKFIKNPINGINSTDRAQSSNTRGNIFKEITSGSITWKVFVKGLRILGFSDCEITFKLRTPDGKEITYIDTIVP